MFARHIILFVAGQNESQVKVILTWFDSQVSLSSSPIKLFMIDE